MRPKQAPPTTATPIPGQRRAAPARKGAKKPSSASTRRPSTAPKSTPAVTRRPTPAAPARTVQRPAIRPAQRPQSRAPQRPKLRSKPTAAREHSGHTDESSLEDFNESPRVARLGDERRRRVTAGLIRNVAVVLAVIAGCAGLVWLVAFSPVLAVKTIQVQGADTTGKTTVRSAVSPALGVPLVRLNMDQHRAAVAELPGVASADVSRSWPSSVVVRVAEHVPVGQIKVDDEVRSLAPDGTVYRIPGVEPSGPMVTVTSAPEAQERTLQVVAKVLASLPAQTAELVSSVSAESPDSVTFDLTSGAKVLWGDNSEPLLKARVLELLMRDPAERYDVSAPSVPARAGTAKTATPGTDTDSSGTGNSDTESSGTGSSGATKSTKPKPGATKKSQSTQKPATGSKPAKSAVPTQRP